MRRPLALSLPALLVAGSLSIPSLQAQGISLPPRPGSPEYQRHYGDMGIRGMTQVEGRPHVINALGQLIPVQPAPAAHPPVPLAHQLRRQAFLSLLPSPSGPYNPSYYSLDSYQTPIRNQESRNTCFDFAAVAALEAAYKRSFSLNLDLSEQYTHHLYKSTPFNQDQLTKGFHYENQASYWEFGDIYYTLDLLKNYRIPAEDGQAHAGRTWTGGYPLPTYETGPVPIGNGTTYRYKYEMDKLLSDNTAAAGLMATDNPDTSPVTQANVDAWEYSPTYMPWQSAVDCRYGVTGFTWLGDGTDVSTSTLEQTLLSGKEVVISMDLFWKSTTSGGVTTMDYNATLKADVDAGRKKHPGNHAVLLIGYDRTNQIFFFKNSWGGTSYLRTTYDFMAKCLTRAVVVDGVVDPNAGTQVGERWLGRWNMDHDGWKGQLVVRRLPDAANDPVRLGSYIDGNGASHDVNGWLTDGGQGIVFFMAGGDQVTSSGQQAGQRFEAHTYGWEPSNAAGSTTWNNDAYGLFLSRDPIPGQYHAGFDRSLWVGTWDMDHDGWHGALSISRVYDRRLYVGGRIISFPAFDATYTAGDGTVYRVAGSLSFGKTWQASFTIPFPGNSQPFNVNFHTWESNVFSGSTVWNGTTFGVHAIKR